MDRNEFLTTKTDDALDKEIGSTKRAVTSNAKRLTYISKNRPEFDAHVKALSADVQWLEALVRERARRRDKAADLAAQLSNIPVDDRCNGRYVDFQGADRDCTRNDGCGLSACPERLG